MKKPLGFTVLLVLLSLLSFGQEICNDGIDNDGDGFIDCFDKKCSNNAACSGNYTGNNPACQAIPSSFPKFSMKQVWGSLNQTTDHLTRVSIGDIDRDGFPEVVVGNSVTDVIYVLDGRDGSTKKSLAPGYDVRRETIIGNIDNDNCAEIFEYGSIGKDHYIFAYDCNLNEIWRTMIRTNKSRSAGDPVHFGLADFNGDGNVELYCKDMVLNAKTGAILVNSTSDWSKMNGGPVAVDMEGTADLELVLGCQIYDVNLGSGTLTLLKSVTDYKTRQSPNTINYHTTSVADYNLDGFLDVIATGSYVTEDNTTAFFWDVKNNVVKTFNEYIAGNITIAGCNGSTGQYYKTGWESGMGRINIADLDGNGRLNASFISGKYMYALDENFNQFWRKDVKEETSGYTGCTLFDFNGDGKSEVVYRDEKFIYIIDGTNGATLTTQTCVARTQMEYPIVADVDGDGSTELCVTCGFDDALAQANFCDNDYYKNGHVRAFKSAAEPWVPARRLWNQHGYFNVNINDDLTIPKRQQKHHLVFSSGSCTQGPNRPLNTFLNQSPFINTDGCPTYPSPDLVYVNNSFSINPPTCPDQNFTVSFQITNQGDVSMSGNIPITFYSGDPFAPGAVKLNTVLITLNNFKPGDIFSATNITVTGPGTNFTLFGVVNDAGTSVPSPITLPNTNFLECDYNNGFSAPVNPLPFALTANKLADNIKCVGGSSPDNGSVEAYRLVGAVHETAPYTFNWFNSVQPVSGAPAYLGSVYSGLPQGTYSVFARHTAFQCSSDTVSVQVNQISTPVTLQIVLDNPYTNCKNPNAKLHVVVNGGAPVGDYTYVWYEGNDIFTSPQIGVSHVATGLKNLTYTVLVTSKLSGCQSVESFTIPDQTVKPVVTTATVDIICSNASSGSASATIGGLVAGYKFEWYDGNNVKPTPDFVGDTYSNLTQGTYTVVVTDNSSKCSSDPVPVTINQTPSITVAATKTANQTSCDNLLPNGAGSANVGGQTAGFTFQWFKGKNTLPANLIPTTGGILTGQPTGIYTVLATDAITGCQDTDEITITDNVVASALTLSSKSDMTVCTPLNGTITLNVLPGNVADFTFSWYNGTSVKATPDFPTTGPTLSGLPAGDYTAVAVNPNTHCSTGPITVSITDNTTPITISNPVITEYPSDCTSNNGKMNVNAAAAGNTLGFQFDWYNGKLPVSGAPFFSQTGGTNSAINTSVSASCCAAGFYTVIVTNLNTGCQNSKELYLPSLLNDALTPRHTDVSVCPPNPVNGQVVMVLDINTSVIARGPNDYRLDLYKNGSVVASILGSAANILSPTQVEFTFSNLDIGTYEARTVDINSLGFCPTISSSEIVKNIAATPVPTITQVAPNTHCAGAVPFDGQLSGSATGGTGTYNFQWFTGQNNTNPADQVGAVAALNNRADGFYTLKVIDATNGCTSTTASYLQGNTAVLDLTIVTTPVTMCAPLPSDGSITITDVTETTTSGSTTNPYNPANHSIVWMDFNQAVIPDPVPENIYTNLAQGSYFVELTNTNTNCKTSHIAVVANDARIFPTVDLVSFTNPTQCLQPANITGDLTVTASGNNITGYSFAWYSGATANPGSEIGLTATLSGLTVASDYTVRVTNNTTQCLMDMTYPISLDVRPVTLMSSASPYTNCASPDGVIFATVTSGSPNNYSYSWDVGTTVSPPPDFTGKQVNNLTNNDYTVIATDLADPGCQSPVQTVTITDERVFPNPAATMVAPLTNCDPAKSNGVASASVGGDLVNFSYDWFVGSSVAGTSFYTGAEVGGLTNTTYTVLATNLVSGCTGTASVDITNASLPVPNPDVTVLSDVTSCVTDNGMISASVAGNTKDYIFDWSDGSVAATPPAFTGELYQDRKAGTYTVIATSRITGCVSGPASGIINNNMKFPEFDLKIVPASCNTDNGSVDVVMTNTVDLEAIEWDVNGVIVKGPVLSDVTSGTYTVTVTTVLGCTTTKTAEVGTEIRPFNGISRNRDGRNDLFYIDCIENFPGNIVRIYNRAGTLVFQESGYNNLDIYFDGRSNKGISPMGNNLPDGTYYYVIEKGDGSEPLAGYLEIVR